VTIAAYVGVRGRGRKDDGQRAGIEQWLAANHISRQQVVWYADRESGGTQERPEFDRLRRDIIDGKVKTVVLWKLDGLSHRLREGVDILADWADRGLRIVVVSQQLEFDAKVGRPLAALLLCLTEIESQFRRECQQAGIAVARKRGIYRGRKPGTTKRKPERAMELKGEGLSPGEIATALGVSERTVFRYLGTGGSGTKEGGPARPPRTAAKRQA
jgi:DNA invertase Pin-like site-specific DNA recombinase